MSVDDPMTSAERRKYLKLMKPMYEVANRKEKNYLVAQMIHVTGLRRQSIIRLLRQIDMAK